LRARLIERLNEGLHRKLTLISAPAGFGKTTLVSEWAGATRRPTAWLSLDEGDNDPPRFLTYLVATLRTIAPNIGSGVLALLQSPQSPSPESILTALLNEIITIPDNFVLVLDDYHVLDSKPIDSALTFLLEHLPPQMHLVIATREDPQLPLARLRARDQLTELRVADLRFTPSEAAGFLNQVMGLNLSAEDIAALETRTEGWIVGLQLAAISMQGHQDTTSFIKSFTGSHHFVLDYLAEEVLHQQPESVQTFLLHTSILERLCGSLCDAILLDSSASGQQTLEYLEHANLFIIPLDSARRWYRYHHLFADLLRQRLQQSSAESHLNELHVRASQWYEDNGLDLEAFHHAAAANDIDHAAHLVEEKGMPIHSRLALAPVLNWMASLPKAVLDARPSLWATYAALLLVAGQSTGVEEKLQAAEAAMQNIPPDQQSRNLIGRIAAARATLAVSQYQPETMIVQAQRALEYLNPTSLAFRTTAYWAMGFAHQLQGDRAAAGRAYGEALAISEVSGNAFFMILAATGLGAVQELQNQLYLAAETYRYVLQLFGEHPQPNAAEVHIGLARIFYEWNDLEAAEQHGRQSLELARQYDSVIDRYIISEVFLARVKLAQGDVSGASTILAQANQLVRQHNFVLRMPEVAAAQVLTLLHQGDLAGAQHLAETHDLPMSQARVYLAQGDTSAALAALESVYQQMEAKGWEDERLKVMVLQALVLHAHGEQDKALGRIGDALTLAAPGGFIRLFIDEGAPMAQLLSDAAAQGLMPDYVHKLLAAFDAEEQRQGDKPPLLSAQPLIEPLSQRELELLRLIAQGLSNHEISERLFLALDTVKGHNRRIYGKLQVQRRTEAVARARELGLL
jgi:LuxR family maltose regulon positive regulatory protein